MSNPKDDSLEQIECDVLAEHSGARVVIRRAVRKLYDALDDQAIGRLKHIMKRWCDDPALLTDKMFNGNEGRSPRHNMMLQAFKNSAAKVRLYGFSISISDQKTFIIIDTDMAKKQTKADSGILNRAKSRVDDFLDKYANKEI
jgi:hypothetical protein